MRTIVVGGAIVGALLLSVPAFAQQKTVKACTQEWQANKDANQAKGVTLKAYVTQCRAGGAAQIAPAAPAAAQKTTAAAPAATGQKTVKACVEEWRANRAANEAKGITQKAYVADCRTGKTTAQPTLFPTQPQQTRTTTAPPPAAPQPTQQAPRTTTGAAPPAAAPAPAAPSGWPPPCATRCRSVRSPAC